MSENCRKTYGPARHLSEHTPNDTPKYFGWGYRLPLMIAVNERIGAGKALDCYMNGGNSGNMGTGPA